MRRHLAATVALGVAAVLTIAACGSSPDSSSTATGGDGASTESSSGASESAPATTLNVAYWPGPELKAMQAVVADYNDGQGKTDNVAVKLTTFSTDDMFNKELVEMTTKSSTLDMYYTASYLLGQHVPYLVPFDGLDSSALYPSATDGFSKDGKLYAVPLDASMIGTIYRTDLLDALISNQDAWPTFSKISEQVTGKSLTPKDPADWSWDDFLATAAYFTKSYNPDSPTEYGTILPLKNGAFAGLQWSGTLYSMGGSWTTSDGAPNFNTPEAQAAVELYAKATTLGIASPNSSQGNATSLNAAMTSGSVAFEMQWYSSMAGFNDAQEAPTTAGKVKFVPVPGLHKGHMHLQGVGINAASKNIDAAKKFVAYLMTSHALDLYGNSGGIPPADSFLSNSSTLGDLATLVKDNTITEPSIGSVDALTVATEVSDKLSGAWLGTGDAKAALDALQSSLVAKAGS